MTAKRSCALLDLHPSINHQIDDKNFARVGLFSHTSAVDFYPVGTAHLTGISRRFGLPLEHPRL
jgi:hypothetical protein